MPDEGLDFYEDLQETDLSGKVYGVAGSGDTEYGDDFCVAVDKFAEAFETAGATRGADLVKINLSPEGDDVIQLEKMVDQLIAQVK